MDWDQYLMGMAYQVASKSKDKRTRIGAVVVGPDHEIMVTGYNGFPRGFSDDDPKWHEKPWKNAVTIHAEQNAILTAARVGHALRGCTLYCPWHPCAACAGAIIQSGITDVVVHSEFPANATREWLPRELLDVCGVRVRWWSGLIAPIEVFNDGVLHDLRR